jgi:hypothetical protein
MQASLLRYNYQVWKFAIRLEADACGPNPIQEHCRGYGMNAPMVCVSVIPKCGYRTLFGDCMAFPGVWCTTIRNTGKCLQRRDEVNCAKRN